MAESAPRASWRGLARPTADLPVVHIVLASRNLTERIDEE